MRIRTIKPGFWKSETLASICPFSRLAAIALLNFADDKGYFVCNHLVIRGELFPFEDDSTNVLRAIDDLLLIGFIAAGTASNGKTYGRVVNFSVHQRVDRPQASEIAGLDISWGNSTNDRRTIDEHSTNDRRTIDEHSTNDRRTIDEHSTNDRRTIDEHSTNDRRTIDERSTMEADTEGKGRGREEERKGAARVFAERTPAGGKQPTPAIPRPPVRIAAATFVPTEEHRLIAATRGLDLEKQTTRFRDANRGDLDAPQNWDRRLSAWLAAGRPELAPVAPLAANAGQSRAEVRPPYRWAIERDIREAKAELAREDERYKESRWEANRGTPDSAKHRLAMAESKARMDQTEARIADLESRLGTAV